jgi:hypothetical protein
VLRGDTDGVRGIACLVAGAWLLVGTASASTGRWAPPQRLTWYWQLTGRVRTRLPAAAFDIDGFENSAAEVASLHKRNRHVVCYVDVGTWERWRPDARTFPRSVLGKPNGWPGERWLDVRRLSVLEPIMLERLRMCAAKRFDAVEPDNIDGFANSTGFPITAHDQLVYDEWIARQAHGLGLAVFQKNDPEQASVLQPYFDGALVEQCNQYRECSAFHDYLAAGKPVLDAEYESALYPGFCAADARARIMGALYNLGLDGRRYKPCWAPADRSS